MIINSTRVLKTTNYPDMMITYRADDDNDD